MAHRSGAWKALCWVLACGLSSHLDTGPHDLRGSKGSPDHRLVVGSPGCPGRWAGSEQVRNSEEGAPEAEPQGCSMRPLDRARAGVWLTWEGGGPLLSSSLPAPRVLVAALLPAGAVVSISPSSGAVGGSPATICGPWRVAACWPSLLALPADAGVLLLPEGHLQQQQLSLQPCVRVPQG